MNSTLSPELLAALQDKIDAARTIALFGHHNIDGDAIGSVLGLAGVFEKLGKKVSCFTTLAPGAYFDFVKDITTIQTTFDYGQYDLIGFLDFTGYNRIGGFTLGHEEYFNNANLFVVDHHIDDPEFLTDHALRLKDSDASSNCELLLEICHAIWPEHIDNITATHWYMGLLTDTGKFEYQQDSIRTFANAAQLVQYGADYKSLMKYLFNYAPKGLLTFMSLIAPRITFTGHVCSLRYTLDEVQECKLDQDQAEACMIFVRSVYNVGVFAEIKVEHERIRLSLRAGYTDNGRLDVQKIAKTLTGGGHMYAAGCAVPRNHGIALEEQISTIIGHINSEAEKQL